MAKRRPRVLITGGGSGGHIYPLIAVLQKLSGVETRYLGAPGIYKSLLQNTGIKVTVIPSSKFRRYLSFLNVIDVFKFIIGFKLSLWHLFWYMPDVVFSKGGPGSLPVVLAAKLYFIPIIIHESDAIPGLTSRISAKFANVIDLAFDAAKKYFRRSTQVVGQPIRDELFIDKSRQSALSVFGFSENKPVVLILGGSQGAEAINDFILENAELFLKKFQIIHQVGAANYKTYQQEYNFLSKNWPSELRDSYYFSPFLEQISDALTAADIVVSRAGAGAIFESAAKGKASVLIPLPASVNPHQLANAYEYQKAGAAQVIEQENLLPHLFVDVIQSILDDAELKKKMENAAKAFFKPNAAKMIAEQIKSFVV